ncbi:MAG: indole-3-glycerol phosphate synthase TrpC [Chloroflexota bacterium]|nr:MAG: indole-3-glycerol phosphate synthase TrpC [Chloroflexota bacterium]
MSSAFVRTGTVLDRILERKAEDVAARKLERPLADVRREAETAAPPRDFAGALRRDTVALIAEVKRASPSKGVLIDPFDPVELATTYAGHGAAAISVLTDEPFFQGHLDHLRAVRGAVGIPLLRKDFTLDPYQVYEGRAAGADAMLLIVAALEDWQMAELHALVTALGMAALVEVHNEAEVERALKLGATLIGVNNRDLKTFQEDISTTERLARLLPDGVTLVAESAIRSAEDVRRMGAAGARAVLVGEGLVKAGNIAGQVQLFSSQPREGVHG